MERVKCREVRSRHGVWSVYNEPKYKTREKKMEIMKREHFSLKKLC